MPPRSKASLARLTFAAVMCAGLYLMVEASTSYLELGEAHPFFLEKLPLARPKLWLGALYVHVPSALFALPACLVLQVGRVRTRFPGFHRGLGRITGVLVLLAVVPTGLYLAFFAQGGLVTTLGFWLTGLITFVAMVKSIASARAGDLRAHRRYATHVTAQLSVAVFSRFLLVGVEQLELYGEWAYVASLYLPVLACAAVAELTTGSRRLVSKGAVHEEAAVVPALDALR